MPDRDTKHTLFLARTEGKMCQRQLLYLFKGPMIVLIFHFLFKGYLWMHMYKLIRSEQYITVDKMNNIKLDSKIHLYIRKSNPYTL